MAAKDAPGGDGWQRFPIRPGLALAPASSLTRQPARRRARPTRAAVPALLLAPDLLRPRHAEPGRPTAQQADNDACSQRKVPDTAASAPYPAGCTSALRREHRASR